jgi:hypothetical protein
MSESVILNEETIQEAIDAYKKGVIDSLKRPMLNHKEITSDIDLDKVIQLVHDREKLKWIGYWNKKYEWR